MFTFALLAIIVSLFGGLFTALKSNKKKFYGFCGFLVADVLWLIYGFSIGNFWVILQFVLFAITALIGLLNHMPKTWNYE